MSTRVYGSYSGHWRSYLDYDTTQNDERLFVQFSGGWQTVGWYYQFSNNLYTSCGWKENGTEHRESSRTDISVYETYSSTYEHKWWNWTGTSFYFNKAHTPRTVQVWIYCSYSGSYSEAVGDSQATSYNITVPAKTNYAVTFDANGGTDAPASQTKWYGETLTLTEDEPTRTNYTFQGWSTSSTGAVVYQPGGTYTGNSAVTLYAVWEPVAPVTAPTIGTNTRNSDTQNTIGWSFSGSDVVAGFIVERSTNSGEWVQVGTAAADATSYVDTTTSANASYSYRVKAYNQTGAGPYSSASGTTKNTPSAPSDLTAVFDASYYVDLAWTNSAVTETATEVYTSTDGQSWTLAATVSGADVTAYTDTNPPAGNAYYKTANICVSGGVTLRSAFSNAVQVVTLAQPNPPTVTSPSNGAVFDMPASIAFTWKHNAVDGTPQQSATVAISTDGTTWTETALSQSSNSWTCNTSSMPRGTVLRFKVKTKGTFATASEYSAVRTVYIRQAPSISITEPTATDGGTISDVPVRVSFGYTDNSGSFSGAALRVSDSNGRTLYSNSAPAWTASGSSYSFDIPVAYLLPANNQTYTATVTAASSSGLSVTASRVFATDYAEPNPPAVSYEINTETASVTVNVAEGTGASVIETVAVGLFRVDASGEHAIAATMDSGSSVTDYLPPLDQEFTYRAVAYTVNGLTSQTLVPVTVDSGGAAFFNWGQGNTETASFAMDAAWTADSTPNRALYEVVGLVDPVLRTTTRRTRKISASGTVWWGEESRLVALQDVPGRVWFREPRGGVTPVAATVKLTWPKGSPTVSVSVSMTQVAEV